MYTSRSLVREGVPGVGYTGWGAGRAIPVPRQDPSQDPDLVIFQGPGPTYGQMKVNLSIFLRTMRIGSHIDLELTRIDPRIDP